MIDDDLTLLLRAAAWAGAHALVLFGLLLAAALAATWGLWHALRRHVAPRLRRWALPPLAALAARAGVGFALIVAAAALFAEIADELGGDEPLAQADAAFTDALRGQVPRPALQAFAALTRLGDTATLAGLCIVVALALLWRQRRLLATAWVGAVAGNGLLNVTLKQVFARVRPQHDDGLVLAHGFSFPSGHSSGALVAYGMLAYLAMHVLPPRWQLPAVLMATALAVGIGASRVFLRVHYVSDVAAGFASGAAWLAVCVLSAESLRRRAAAPGAG